MMTGLIYVSTSIMLMWILSLTRSLGHEVTNGVEVFRYQPGPLIILLWGSPIPLALAIFVYAVTNPKMNDFSLAILLMVGVIASSLVYYTYTYLKSICIEVGLLGITIRNLRKSKYIDYKNVSRVDYIDGGKGVYFLDLFDAAGKRIAHLPGTLRDFDGLCQLIRTHATACGAFYRQRNMWGKWSE